MKRLIEVTKTSIKIGKKKNPTLYPIALNVAAQAKLTNVFVGSKEIVAIPLFSSVLKTYKIPRSVKRFI